MRLTSCPFRLEWLGDETILSDRALHLEHAPQQVQRGSEMATNGYPYVNVIGSLKKYLLAIPNQGIPAKVTLVTLASQGFKSKNDRTIIAVLKALGFLSDSGAPTEIWKAYRDKTKGPHVMAQAIHEAYADLFNMYPDAYRRDDEALRNFFRAQTSVGDRALSAMVGTFKTLCELAKFNGMQDASTIEHGQVVHENHQTSSAYPSAAPSTNLFQSVPQPRGDGFTLNINIELHLPATQDAEIYDKLFKSLKQNLLDK